MAAVVVTAVSMVVGRPAGTARVRVAADWVSGAAHADAAAKGDAGMEEERADEAGKSRQGTKERQEEWISKQE